MVSGHVVMQFKFRLASILGGSPRGRSVEAFGKC